MHKVQDDPSDFATLDELFRESVRRFGPRPLFGGVTGERLEWLTYRDVGLMVDRMAGALRERGVVRGDRVALVSNNRFEWAVVAYACFRVGAILVPMYEDMAARDCEGVAKILAHCGAVAAFVANRGIALRLAETSPGTATVSLDALPLGASEAIHASFAGMLALGATRPDRTSRPEPSDVACIFYTSGTTSDPKGVMLTHANVVSNVKAVLDIGFIAGDDLSVSVLKWSHVMASTAELHAFVASGASMVPCADPNDAKWLFLAVRPTILYGVPKLLNTLHTLCQQRLAAAPGFLQDAVRTATALKRLPDHGRASFVVRAKCALAERLFFRKVRDGLGGRVRAIISGSAALSHEVATFFRDAGLPVYEGYGLSEASPVVSINTPAHHCPGSVGRPVPGVVVAPDYSALPEEEEAVHDGDSYRIGELIVYGPNVMRGYYRDPERTAARLTPDGGLRTGDIGFVDMRGYVHLIDRLEDHYKLENGTFVYPAQLEERLKASPFVSNVMVYGLNRPYSVALIVPNLQAVTAWAEARGMRCDDACSLLDREDVQTLFSDLLVDARAEGFARIGSFTFLSEDFTTANGLLTDTMKVRRAKVIERHKETIAALYATPS